MNLNLVNLTNFQAKVMLMGHKLLTVTEKWNQEGKIDFLHMGLSFKA